MHGTRYRLSLSFRVFLRRWLRRLGFVPRRSRASAAPGIRLICGVELLEFPLPRPVAVAPPRPRLPALEACEPRNYPNDLVHLAFLPLTGAAAGFVLDPAQAAARERPEAAPALPPDAPTPAVPFDLFQAGVLTPNAVFQAEAGAGANPQSDSWPP